VAEGDPEAVDECLRVYGGLVWSLARRLTVNLSEAEDAVQEVFIDVWRNAKRFDGKIANEATFITMLARRRLIDRHRRRQRDVLAAPAAEAVDEPAAMVEDHVELQEEAARARDGLRQLRDEERRVLELSIYEGLSHREIAARTDLPLGTVKTHARRGLQRLREMLGRNSSQKSQEVAR
jgi:RNA polymerase sigma-70 factor (ECF subfamily)